MTDDNAPARNPHDEVGDFSFDWAAKLRGTSEDREAGRVRLGMHQYFAAEHIRAAKLMADKCRQREDECLTEDLPFVDFEVRSYALAAIMESVAFLEAVINEFIYQVAYFADGNSRLAGLDSSAIECLRQEQVDNDPIARLRIMEKYDLTMSCAGEQPIDKGRSPGQDVVALIHARNALVHYRTEMHWDDTVHRVERQVKHLVEPNPLMEGARPWFPHHLLCASVARWAWSKSVELEQSWQQSLGVQFHASSQPARYISDVDEHVVVVVRAKPGGDFDVLGSGWR